MTQIIRRMLSLVLSVLMIVTSLPLINADFVVKAYEQAKSDTDEGLSDSFAEIQSEDYDSLLKELADAAFIQTDVSVVLEKFLDDFNEIYTETPKNPVLHNSDASVLKTGDESSGILNGTITWEWNSSSSILTIGGTGEIPAFYPEFLYEAENIPVQDRVYAPWEQYVASAKKIVIGEGITSIGNGNFAAAKSLTEVEFNDGLTSIGSLCFAYAVEIEKITFPATLRTIGNRVFIFSFSLSELFLNEGLKSVGEGCFESTINFTKLYIPSTLESGIFAVPVQASGEITIKSPLPFEPAVSRYVNSDARDVLFVFTEASGKYSLGIYNNFIPETSVDYTELLAVFIKDYNAAFNTSYNINNYSHLQILLNKIDNISNAFVFQAASEDLFFTVSGNEAVHTLCREMYIRHINGSEDCDCFTYTGTVTDSISWTVDKASQTLVFSGEGELPYADETTLYSYMHYNYIIKHIKFAKDSKITLIGSEIFAYMNFSDIVIPASVTSVGSYAFRECGNLSDVQFEDKGRMDGEIEAFAFYHCNNIKEITIPEHFNRLAVNAFAGSGIEKIIILNNSCVFGNGSSVSAVIPNEATIYCYYGSSASEYAEKCGKKVVYFSADGFWYYTLVLDDSSEKVASIYEYRGNGTEVVIPEELDGFPVVCVGDQLFYGNSDITKIILHENIEKIGKEAFANCISLKEISLPDTMSYLGDSVFSGCCSLNNITLPYGITSGLDEMFYGCTALESVVIPDTVTYLGNSVFYNCTALESVEIPDTVTSIGKEAFYNCTALTDISLPSSLEAIGVRAFGNCRALEKINLPETLEMIAYYAFENCIGLKKIVLPGNITEILSYTFANCKALESVSFPDSVKWVQSYAFDNCESLRKVITFSTDVNLQYDIFSDCYDLTFYGIPYSDWQAYAEYYSLPFKGIVDVDILVVDENGETVESGFFVKWYDYDGNMIADGLGIKNALPGEKYRYSIELDESLAYEYKQIPDVSFVVPDEDETIVCQLVKIDSIKIRGKVTDSDGNALEGTLVEIEQAFDGRYSTTDSYYTDENGEYYFDAYRVVTKLTFSIDGYLDKNKTVYTFRENDEEEVNVVLSKIPENKITLKLLVESAKASGGETVVTTLNNVNGLTFEVYNKTKDKNISDYIVQYPYIILPDNETEKNDEIIISITDRNKKMTVHPIRVVLDENRKGNAEVKFVENGKFTADITGVGEKLVVIFDSLGNRVSKKSLSGNVFCSDSLPEGEYTALFIQDSEYLSGLSSLEVLNALKLKDADYITKNIRIKNGEITNAGEIKVPSFDETKLYYTIADKTGIYLNETSVITGKYLITKVQYKIDERYDSSEEKLVIELPDGIELVDNSMTFKSKLAVYSEKNNVIEVLTNASEGELRFYVVAGKAIDSEINARLEFTCDGSRIIQPLGASPVESVLGIVKAPSQTKEAKIFVSGTTLPNSNVTVFVDGEKSANVVSNKVGLWGAYVELKNTFSYSYHSVYAEASRKDLDEAIKSDTAQVIFNSGYIPVKTVTMYNVGDNTHNVTVFDYENPKFGASYLFSGSDFKFTFVVDFGDYDSLVNNVVLHVYQMSGKIDSVPMSYMEDTDSWAGKAEYASENEVPVNVSVSYDYEMPEDFKYSIFESDGYEEFSDYLSENYVDDVEDGYDIVIAEETEDYTVIEFKDKFNSGEGFSMYLTELAYSLFEDADLTSEGFIPLDDEGVCYYALFATDALCYNVFVDTVSEGALAFSYHNLYEDPLIQVVPDYGFMYPQLHMTDPISLGSELGDVISDAIEGNIGDPHAAAEYAVGKGLDLIGDGIDEIGDVLTQNRKFAGVIVPGADALIAVNDHTVLTQRMKALESEMHKKMQQLRDMIVEKCPGSDDFVLSAEDRARALALLSIMTEETAKMQDEMTEMLKDYSRRIGNSVIMDTLTAGIGKAFKLLKYTKFVSVQKYRRFVNKYAPPNEDYADDILETIGATGSEKIVEYNDDKFGVGAERYHEKLNEYEDIFDNYFFNLQDFIYEKRNCDPPPPKDDEIPEPEHPYVTPILDPSGYVYEAVPSNRVEGVKAEAYYYDYPLDEFGMPMDEKEEIFWDASEYNQINPLYTDANGMYSWDVPPGQWLVKYSKEGYYDTDSRSDVAADSDGYLPVPPPQVEVNTAIVSKVAPTVSNVNIYDDCIQIIFSQYMKPSTVNSDTVKVYCAGTEVKGSVSPVNTEYNYEKTQLFASIFTFTPEKPLNGEVSVKISGADNYAGTKMLYSHSASSVTSVKPESISVSDSVNIEYSSEMAVTLQIVPAQAGANKSLTITSSAPGIIGIAEETIMTDANGRATIKLSGNLPGGGTISAAIDGTDISTSFYVNVGNVDEEYETCEKVVASVTSGSAVAEGTKVSLSTATEDAEIYYTLDGTCPCVTGSASRIRYTGPIVINEDTFIIAYAVKEGANDSATAGFVYTIRKECPHNNTKDVPGESATCKETGVSAGVYCNDCNTYISGHMITEINPDAHKWNKGEVTTAATCSVNGVKTFTCQNNTKHTRTENLGIDKNNHTDTKIVPATDATPVSVGYTEGVYCNACKKFISGHKEIPKKPSVFTDSETAVADGEYVIFAATLRAGDILKNATQGSILTDKDGRTVSSDADAVTGMLLVLPDGKSYSLVCPGDVNSDGKITAADARFVLRASVGLEKIEAGTAVYKAADINGGNIAAADARLILRASVGLENQKDWIKG